MELPAGRYFIGDPSYLLDQAELDPILALARRDRLQVHGGVWFWRTAYGDGLYALQHGSKREPERIAVDSGKLCVLPAAAYGRESLMARLPRERMLRLVAEIELCEPCLAYVEAGDLYLGDVKVHTSDQTTPTYAAWSALPDRDAASTEIDARVPFSTLAVHGF